MIKLTDIEKVVLDCYNGECYKCTECIFKDCNPKNFARVLKDAENVLEVQKAKLKNLIDNMEYQEVEELLNKID